MADWMSTYWPIVTFLFSVVLVPIAGWAIRMGLASKGDLADEARARETAIDEVESRLEKRLGEVAAAQAELGDRVLSMETEIRHLPSAGDIADLKTEVVRTRTQVEGFQREFASVTRSLTRIEDFLFKDRPS